MCEGRTAVVVYLLLALIGVGVGCAGVGAPAADGVEEQTANGIEGVVESPKRFNDGTPEVPQAEIEAVPLGVSLEEAVERIGVEGTLDAEGPVLIYWNENHHRIYLHFFPIGSPGALRDREGPNDELSCIVLEKPDGNGPVFLKPEEYRGRAYYEVVRSEFRQILAKYRPAEPPADVRCDESLAASGGVCWSRCPLRQEWQGGHCEGTRLLGITIDEARKGCAKLGAGCGVPSQRELMKLLGPRRNAPDSPVEFYVQTCAESPQCSGIYGDRLDGMTLWAVHSYGYSHLGHWVSGPDGVVTRRSGDLPGDDPIGAVCVCHPDAAPDGGK